MSSLSEKRVSLGVMVPLGVLFGTAGIGASIVDSIPTACIYGAAAMCIAICLAQAKIKAHRDSTVFDRIYVERASSMRIKLSRMVLVGVSIAASAFLLESWQSSASTLMRCLCAVGGMLIAVIGVIYARFLRGVLRCRLND